MGLGDIASLIRKSLLLLIKTGRFEQSDVAARQLIEGLLLQKWLWKRSEGEARENILHCHRLSGPSRPILRLCGCF